MPPFALIGAGCFSRTAAAGAVTLNDRELRAGEASGLPSDVEAIFAVEFFSCFSVMRMLDGMRWLDFSVY